MHRVDGVSLFLYQHSLPLYQLFKSRYATLYHRVSRAVRRHGRHRGGQEAKRCDQKRHGDSTGPLQKLAYIHYVAPSCSIVIQMYPSRG